MWSPQYGGLHAELEAIMADLSLIAHRIRDCEQALINLHRAIPEAEQKELEISIAGLKGVKKGQKVTLLEGDIKEL